VTPNAGFPLSFPEGGNANAAYYNMFQQANRSTVVQHMQSAHALVRWDLLRACVFAMSASPEAYLALRSHFARTLATFNIASYIIGIGDRHLENFLLDMKTGGLIGIDFGHAFGTATQFLPIPELMPFRLTRQLIGFLQPLDTEGLLKHNMMHTLRGKFTQELTTGDWLICVF
jgi:DNA-dependent protein kinase catalytic subunit